MPIHFATGLALGAVALLIINRTAKQNRELAISRYLHSVILKKKGEWWLLLFIAMGSMAVIFSLNATLLGVSSDLIFWQTLSFALVLCAGYDLVFRLIPTSLVGATVVLSLVQVVWVLPEPALGQSLVSGAIVGGVVLLLYLLTKGRGIGEADVLMALIIGLLFGWKKGLLVFSAGNFLGLLGIIPLIPFVPKQYLRQVPLIFFLVLAIFLEWYTQYSSWILQSIGLPS